MQLHVPRFWKYYNIYVVELLNHCITCTAKCSYLFWVLPKFYWQNKQSNWGLSLSFKLWPDRDSSLELCIVANSNYLIKSAKLLAKSQFTHGKEASSSILCLYKLLRQWYERINRKYKLQQLDIHKVRQYMLEKTVHARKEEYWTEKLFLATS